MAMTRKVTAPNISESTMKSMWNFFLKTSVPRILEAERKKKESEEAAQ